MRDLLLLLPLLLVFALVAVRAGKLTIPAAVAACLTGALVFMGAGWIGIALLGVFFVLGVGATGHKKKKKAEMMMGARTAGQVFANGGFAAIMGALAWWYAPTWTIFDLMLAASLAAATADTLSSELGMVYGRRFFNILSFKREMPGPDGVISLEGTLIGAAGAAIIAGTYSLAGTPDVFWPVLLGGVGGNIVDSLLGASLERRGWIGNNVVNFLNTTAGGLIAWGLFTIFIR
ncbi:DUF92 domain-containing protein [Chitinophaga horti]|uniref:DUF92 domain-containing protein n=1 Tax=Chitinophaga horti TaxID=2920382 RepID=A0ABY6J853_9BACT|nr:DUF92 domain-containing protein [Chitinophaga horti]UYQ95818.1 DUF92 domain-containing protein [Chitinophaga horti]